MRIKECRVYHYGPLRDTGTISLGDFSLLYGPNESGKTLLVDAIIKMMLRGKAERRSFSEDIDRVEENPDGYLVVQWQGKDYKLPDDGGVTEIAEISSQDCRNVFIVRSSDLAVKDQAGFYGSVTDRLTGLHTKAIKALKKEIQQIGRLTTDSSHGSLSNRREWGHLGERVQRAESLLAEIGALEERLEAEGFEDLESRLLGAESQSRELDHELELLEKARHKTDYEDLDGAISEIKKGLRAQRKLEAFTEERHQAWRDAERDEHRLNQEIDELETADREVRARRKELKQLETDASRKLEKLQRRADDIVEIRHKVEELLEDTASWEEKKHLLALLGRVSIAFAGLTGFTLASLVLTSFSALVYLAAVSLACAVLSAFVWALLVLRRGSLDKKTAKLRTDAAKHGITSTQLVDVAAGIEAFNETAETTRNERARISAELASAEEELANNRQAIRTKRTQLEDLRQQVRDVQTTCGVKRLATFARKLGRRQHIEREIDKRVHFLTKRLASTDSGLEADLEHWQERTHGLAPDEDEALLPEYDEERFEALQSERDGLAESIESTKMAISECKAEMGEIGGRASTIFEDLEPILIDTSLDLRELKHRLMSFVQQIAARTQLSIEAMRILEDIEEEEARKVAKLFGAGTSVSAIFKEITGGLYHQVTFDPLDEQIWVETQRGSQLKASSLSRGAYDQLYLAIRLALAEKLLGIEQGFLLLDDPFLASDSVRLARQLQILHGLVSRGWQVIYLTVKDEVREHLTEETQEVQVLLHELSSLVL